MAQTPIIHGSNWPNVTNLLFLKQCFLLNFERRKSDIILSLKRHWLLAKRHHSSWMACRQHPLF
ncbi:MAG: hypothetical protein R3Y10_00610 [Ferrimonas sp.]